MREKHCAFSIYKIIVMTVLLLGFLILATPQAFADNGHKGNYKHKEWQKDRDKGYRKHKEETVRESGKHREELGRENRTHHKEQDRESRNRLEMKIENGYRERPYDKNRHYVKYVYKGHRYNYHGHWRSWEEWDRYAKKYPHIYKYGRYYRENAHLMFRFCAPETASCFFFSIGR